MQSEKEIQTQIVDYLKSRGFFVIRNYMGPIHYHGSKVRPNPNAGMPDLSIIKNGITSYIEVKKEKGKVSDKQKEWHLKAYKAGVVVHIFRSLEECMVVFN